MSVAVINARAAVGVEAPSVTVEVHLANGLPALSVVGLPEAAVKESKDRVRSAIVNSGFEFPARRITVNLAPADLPKEGGRFDLPIALGILAASGQLRKADLSTYEFIGELALTGALRPVNGVLPSAAQCAGSGRAMVVAADNAGEAALVKGLTGYAAPDLLGVCRHLIGEDRLPEAVTDAVTPGARYPDLDEVRGQHQAKRCLAIAAAGAHSILFMGPPGTGKSMLASRLPGILPPMTDKEALESAAVQSVSGGGFDPSRWGQRPYRTPHHSASHVALIGGGARPRPGEVSLAHHGVLFLDELPEFSRLALEALREPLETGRVTIARAAAHTDYPASFQLVAAMNPCPCGYAGDPKAQCRCTPEQTSRYRGRLSGPLLDRIDMIVEVPRLPASELDRASTGPSSSEIRGRTESARARQHQRAGSPNAHVPAGRLSEDAALSSADRTLLASAIDRMGLSARAYHRILRVARTIADLDGSPRVHRPHLTEALGYRRIDPSRQAA
ncbi:YifB family Mg chelatase-like AAA ATPase [Ectothiorhodospiraceae bacterium WFHF3C12]|nr:YifB family Mg chelatase-like AAA ATPase [Ectothiorhodospiraceae bacterium WFHF3C12]